MRFLSNLIWHKRRLERLKVFSEMFRYSRPEDMAKVFELGRIEALHTVWLVFIIGFVGLVGVIVGLFDFFIEPKIDAIIDSRVEREIDKRIDQFSNFYKYSKEVIPILEHDFYQIGDIRTTYQVKFNENIGGEFYPMPVFVFPIRIFGRFLDDAFKYYYISFFAHPKDSKGVYIQESIHGQEGYTTLIGRQIDIFERFTYLEIVITYAREVRKSSESELYRLTETMNAYVNSIDAINMETYINEVHLYSVHIQRNDLKKSGDFDYSAKIDWRNIIKANDSVKRKYLVGVKSTVQ